jgi:deoxyxylulose-5-phosphate synthase
MSQKSADSRECQQMQYTGIVHEGPASMRYPRGKGLGVAVEKNMTALPLGKAELRYQGSRIAILMHIVGANSFAMGDYNRSYDTLTLNLSPSK